MKTAAAFILSLVYITFSIGITIHQHYCMGELVGKSLLSFEDQKCGKCGMEKHTEASKDCCKDVSIVIKSSDSHTFSQTVYDFDTFAFILAPIHFNVDVFNIPESQTANLYRAHSPPLLKIPLFLQFGNFRI